MRNNNLAQNKDIFDELLNLANAVLNKCQHPRKSVIGMFVSNGGTEHCTICRKVRYQAAKNGPWGEWKDNK
jgi:hypothetical protein